MTWDTARKAALARDGERCRRCLRPATVVHHRQLKGMGGTDDPEVWFGLANLLSLCWDCHTWVHLHPEEAHSLGFIVLSWENPADVPLKNPETLIF